ncbi:MAG: hypothetical protein ABIU06_06395 [Anaerolineales bacterium]
MNEIDQATVLKAAELFKQWMFTAGGDTRTLVPATGFVEGMDNRYGLKNMQIDEHLRWKDGMAGINLGYEKEEAQRWIVSRCVESTEPIKYGDTIAIGYGTQPTWVNHEEQTFGPNLEFQSKSSCEWKIFGGPIGTPVKTNERVALLNEKYGEPVVHVDRPVGANIGPASARKDFWDKVKDLFQDIGDVIEAVAKVLDLYESVTESDEQPNPGEATRILPGEPGVVSGSAIKP